MRSTVEGELSGEIRGVGGAFLFCFRVEDITVFLCAACNDLVGVDADDTGKRRTIARGMPSSRQEAFSDVLGLVANIAFTKYQLLYSFN